MSSAFECPCGVNMMGSERDLKWDVRVRMLGRAVVVMERKKCCMSITRTAVAILTDGFVACCW